MSNLDGTTEDTPVDAPFRRRQSDPAAEKGQLSRVVPELGPMPPEPTVQDVAVRYGSFAVFITRQWPLLVDFLERSYAEDTAAHLRLDKRARTAWVWPLVTGFSLATAIASILTHCH